MSKRTKKSIVKKSALAALTVATATFGMTGLASATASISNTGYGSNNTISYGGHGWSSDEHKSHTYWKPSSNQHDWGWSNGWDWQCWHQDHKGEYQKDHKYKEHDEWVKKNNDHKKWDNYGHHDDYKKDNHGSYGSDHKVAYDWNKHDSGNDWSKQDHGDDWKKWDNNNHDEWKSASHDNDWDKKDHSYVKHDNQNDKYWDDKHGDDWKNDDYSARHRSYDKDGGYGGHGGSSTTYRASSSDEVEVNNDNDVRVTNNVHQVAVTGDATSSYNTHGGHVQTGDATNYSNNAVNVDIDNSSSYPSWSSVGFDGWGGSDYSIRDTGYGSRNLVDLSSERSLEVNNDNDVRVTNNVSQTAVSGDATSKYNTWGGNVMSGNASNWQAGYTNVSIKN